MHEVKLLGPWAFVLMSCFVAGGMGAAALALLVGLRWRPPAFLWLLGPWVLCCASSERPARRRRPGPWRRWCTRQR